VTPAYYWACAAQAREQGCRYMARSQAVSPSGPPLDAACETLLRQIGVREREQLAGVPYELIAAWHAALAHPGMAAQFRAPVGFAVSQMHSGNSPPTQSELDS
jgi:hypothetical protein